MASPAAARAASATMAKARMKRQGGMAQGPTGAVARSMPPKIGTMAPPGIKSQTAAGIARMAPDGINKMSDDGKVQTMVGQAGKERMPMPPGASVGPEPMTKPMARPMDAAAAGAIGQRMPQSMPPGLEAASLSRMLPPAMQQKPAWQQLQQAGIGGQGSAMANKAKLAEMQGVFPPGGDTMQSFPMPDAAEGAIGQGPPGGAPTMSDTMPPPGAEQTGGPTPPGAPPMPQGAPPMPQGGPQAISLPFGQGGPQGGMQGGLGGMNPQRLRQMLPPAMQQAQGAPFAQPASATMPRFPGGGPNPGVGGPQGGGNPFRYM